MRRIPLVCIASCLIAGPIPAQASAFSDEVTSLQVEKPIAGQPTVTLDRLDFPQAVLDRPELEKHLRRILKREVYRVDWGAGAQNKIEYRFVVSELSFTVDGHALRIKCAAMGRLPGGEAAKSELTFGGDISKRLTLSKQVLEIVARGVVTRLAELERKRRGLE